MIKIEYEGYLAVRFDHLFKVYDRQGKEILNAKLDTDISKEQILDYLIALKQIRESGD